jgi:hypothetical protein
MAGDGGSLCLGRPGRYLPVWSRWSPARLGGRGGRLPPTEVKGLFRRGPHVEPGEIGPIAKGV